MGSQEKTLAEKLQPLIQEATKMESVTAGTYHEGYWHGVKVGLEIALEQSQKKKSEGAGVMKHKWSGGMTAGTADYPPEGYMTCDNCGVSMDDENQDEECRPEDN